MVKPLADILSEIEERNSILGFRPGGDVDDTPADPGQDDTLGEEDEQVATMDDMQGLIDAGAYGDPNSASAVSQAMVDLELANKAHGENVREAGIEQLAYINRNPEYMDLVEKGQGTPFTGPARDAVIKDTLSSRGFLDPSGGTILATLLGFGAGLPLGFGYKAAEDYAKNPARAALAQSLSQKGYTPTEITENFKSAGIENLDKDDITDAIAGVGRGDIATTQFSDLIPDPPSGFGQTDDIYIPPPLKPTQVVATNMVEEAVVDPSKGWSFDPDTWYTSAAQGGAIDAFSPGGLAGMMMPRQRRIQDHNFTGGSPNVPSQFGRLGFIPQPPQFPGLLGPFGPQRPPLQPPQRPKLDAETYFHTHEGGKVAYPNFPQPFINKEDSFNPFKWGGRKPPLPPARPARPFQPYPQAQVLDEPYIDAVEQGILQPVPPVSISETTATAMQPEEVQETQTTTIEEAPVPREIDIQMPENITATLDFPEQVRGTATYARGGDIPTDEQMKIDDEIVRRQRRTRELLKQIEKMDADMDRNTRILEKLGLIPKKPKPVGIDQEEFYKQEDYLDRLRRLPKEQHKQLKKMPVTTAQGGEIPETYARGGLAGILKSLAPMASGFFLGPMGHIPAMLAGAGTQYALAGKKRSFLDAIKGGLSGYAGSGIGRLGTATVDATKKAGSIADIGKTFTPAGAADKTTYLADAYAKAGPGSGYILNPNITSFPQYGDALAKSGEGLWKGLTSLEPATYKALASEGAGPLAAMVGQTAITTPAEMPEMTEIEIAQVQSMTPEERRKYIEDKRRQYADSPLMQPTVFAPPNVDIGFDVTTASDGGVMEIDEEMQSGSFVLPADVVSNVGDGSSTSGHRRLSDLFEMSEEEYAMGGGILKGPIKGPGGGLDDLIQTGIDGVRVARLSSDEFVVPKDVVRRLGNGSQKAGAEKLYDFMKDVRLKKHGTPDQPKEMHMSGLRKMV